MPEQQTSPRYKFIMYNGGVFFFWYWIENLADNIIIESGSPKFAANNLHLYEQHQLLYLEAKPAEFQDVELARRRRMKVNGHVKSHQVILAHEGLVASLFESPMSQCRLIIQAITSL